MSSDSSIESQAELHRNHYHRARVEWTDAGDSTRSDRKDEHWGPAELLIAGLSRSHMVHYLALCADSGLVVTEYVDDAYGTTTQTLDGTGRVTEVTLRPEVAIADPDLLDEATQLHATAHQMSFVANSVNFPVYQEHTIKFA